MKAKTILATVGISLIMAATGAMAQGPVDANVIVCHFETVAINEGPFDPYHVVVRQSDFSITFIKEGDVHYMLGNVGRAQVHMSEVFGGGLVFLEPIVTGTYQVTAIDHDLNAVHSRHTFFNIPSIESDSVTTEIVPSQYYGECQIQ